MSVDLPAPFSPQIAWISSACTVSDTLSRATTPGNRLVIDRISRMVGPSDFTASATGDLLVERLVEL